MSDEKDEEADDQVPDDPEAQDEPAEDDESADEPDDSQGEDATEVEQEPDEEPDDEEDEEEEEEEDQDDEEEDEPEDEPEDEEESDDEEDDDEEDDDEEDDDEEDAPDSEDEEQYEADVDADESGDDASALEDADGDIDAEFSEAGVDEPVVPCPAKAPKKPPKPPTPPTVGNLEVTVVNSKTGKRINGAAVKIAGPEPHNGSTDASGKIKFSGIKTGAYTADATIDGFAPGSGSATVKSRATATVVIRLTPATVSLTVDGVAAGNKTKVGGLIVRNFDGNNAPRKKITISAVTPAGVPGDVIFQCPSGKVKFMDAAVGGGEVKIDGTANRFAPGSLPKVLFAEGLTQSETMRDIKVTLDHGTRTTVDAATLTVLWVDKPTVNLAGRISKNNAKRNAYIGWTKAGTDKLGLQEYNAKFGKRMGCGSEASAKVHPKKFQFPGSNLKLERDFDFRDFNGSTPLDSGTRSATMPPGNDTGPAAARDDDPRPDDTLYDWDAAGLNIPNAPAGTIHRTRNNFLAFASVTAEGKSVRCSENREYFIAFSQEQKKAPSGAKWQIKTPPDVAGDNNVGNGTTKLTFDLT